MTKDELNLILDKHKKWLNCEGDGERADLREANLCGADLRGADLREANLRRANLCGADLRGADLRGANLCGADLRGADLRGANLREANLCGANLCGADLREANLREANLRGADLRRADLREAKNIPFIPLKCPEKGSFIGFKKVDEKIIELEIPAEAKRCSATTDKCRCEFARVLSITNLDGSESGLIEIVNDTYDSAITYKVGEIVYPDSFDNDRWNECSNGIHFFINRQSAVEY